LARLVGKSFLLTWDTEYGMKLKLSACGACSLLLMLTISGILIFAKPSAVFAYTGEHCSTDYYCPNGGECFSHIYTSLCGDQYNVCVTWNHNCADDYHATYKGQQQAPQQSSETSGGAIPGFPVESIFGGLVTGVALLIMIRHRREHPPRHFS